MPYKIASIIFINSSVILLALFICFMTSQVSLSQANTTSPFSKSNPKIEGVTGATSNGKYIVNLQFGPEVVRKGETIFFMVNLFENTGEKQVRLRHVDCDFIIMKDGIELYRMSTQYGEPFFHSINGVMLPNFKFTEFGKYTISTEISGILFVPIQPKSVNFNAVVSPTQEGNLEIKLSALKANL